MKTFIKIIILSVLLIGLSCCSENGFKAKDYHCDWDGQTIIRMVCKDSTVFKFVVRDENSKEATTLLEKSNPEGAVVIPEKFNCKRDTYIVTSIGIYAFGGENVKEVSIPNSVTSIGRCAFYGCSNLSSITIPNSVMSIGIQAFYGCKNLISINIPNSMTGIEDETFYGCSNLSSINIPNSVTSIGRCTFSGCSNLSSINIPNSVTSIGNDAFNGCSGLTSVTIPNSVTRIEDETFYGCSNLSSINIPNSVTSIGRCAFYGCSNLSSITISNSVMSIGIQAFYGCKNLISINIPNSVTWIEEEAFYGCEKLTSIIIPESVTSIGKRVFANCKELTSVTILNPYLQFDYDEVFDGCEKLLRSQVIYEKQEKNEQMALDDIAGFYSNKNENEFGCLFLYYDGSYMTVGYDWPEEKGHYVIQNNEVMFAPSAVTSIEDDPTKWIEVSDRAFYVLPIDNANQKVGRYTKEAFLTEKEVAEAKAEYGDDWVFMVGGDGFCTRSTLEEFKQKSAFDDENTSTPSQSVSIGHSQNQVVVIDGSGLRLRLGPSTSSDTFKWPDGTNRHPKVGDKFKYLGESGDFYKIDFNGNELWVSKQFSHIE